MEIGIILIFRIQEEVKDPPTRRGREVVARNQQHDHDRSSHKYLGFPRTLDVLLQHHHGNKTLGRSDQSDLEDIVLQPNQDSGRVNNRRNPTPGKVSGANNPTNLLVSK